MTRITSLAEKPDLVFLCSYAPGGPSAIRQMRAAGIEAAVLTGKSMDGDYWIGSVPDLSNFYVVNYGSKYGDDPNADVNAFFERFEKKYGKKADVSYGLRGYSAVQAWAMAANKAGSLDGDKVAAVLEHLRQGTAGDRADDLDRRPAHRDDAADGDHRRARTASSPRKGASRSRSSRSSDSISREILCGSGALELAAERVTVRFGGLVATDDVSIALAPGEVLGLIGPNGAGKTTLVNVLSGFQRPHAGSVRLGRQRHDGAPARAPSRGPASCAASRRCGCSRALTVAENVEVGLVGRGLGRAEARRRALALLADFDLAPPRRPAGRAR